MVIDGIVLVDLADNPTNQILYSFKSFGKFRTI